MNTPFVAVNGIVNKKITRINAEILPKNPGLSGLIGVCLPLTLLHFESNSIFQDAPKILPYAKIVGDMKTNNAKVIHVGVNVSPCLLYPYIKIASVPPEINNIAQSLLINAKIPFIFVFLI
ncbi:MAG: Uncharacterised protein [Methanobacteriota archaeon]|nr:MAG: Uncharacterised protein [Euryarchaeota archaeon]